MLKNVLIAVLVVMALGWLWKGVKLMMFLCLLAIAGYLLLMFYGPKSEEG
jgi:hypothetical protein